MNERTERKNGNKLQFYTREMTHDTNFIAYPVSSSQVVDLVANLASLSQETLLHTIAVLMHQHHVQPARQLLQPN